MRHPISPEETAYWRQRLPHWKIYILGTSLEEWLNFLEKNHDNEREGILLLGSHADPNPQGILLPRACLMRLLSKDGAALRFRDYRIGFDTPRVAFWRMAQKALTENPLCLDIHDHHPTRFYGRLISPLLWPEVAPQRRQAA